jgi:hypothetical protein
MTGADARDDGLDARLVKTEGGGAVERNVRFTHRRRRSGCLAASVLTEALRSMVVTMATTWGEGGSRGRFRRLDDEIFAAPETRVVVPID